MKFSGCCLFIGLLILPQSASPNVLSPSDETLAAMIAQTEEDIIFLGQKFGYSNAPLMFTSQLNPLSMSYSYSLTAGSTYNGEPATLTASGVFSSGHWTTATNSTVGLASWSATGTVSFTDPPAGTKEAGDAIQAPDHWDGHTRWTWIDDPDDDSRLLSIGSVIITKNDEFVSARSEFDSRKKTLDELISQYTVNGLFTGGGLNSISTGAGSFIITPVPEPEPACMTLLSLCVALLASRKRRVV